MSKLTLTMGTIKIKRAKSAKKFEKLLTAWQHGEEVAWADLLAAWIKLPTAPRTKETVLKLIGCLERK
jgi:hypothetical protein